MSIGYYIYPSMTNTINYLKSTGEYKLFASDDEIEYVSVESCKNIGIIESQTYGWNPSFYSHQFIYMIKLCCRGLALKAFCTIIYFRRN